MPRKTAAEKAAEEVIAAKVLDTEHQPPTSTLALASAVTGGAIWGGGGFYNPADSTGQALGFIPDKLTVPKEYHKVITLCYDFYQRGGIVATVVNRLTELSITSITNGQRSTTDEANAYFEAVLHRQPSRLVRFIRTAALEYFLSGMVLPRIDWEEINGADLSPSLNPKKTYWVPIVDLYPPKLVQIDWADFGEKYFYIRIPDEDIRTIKRGDGNKIKENQRRYLYWKENYPEIIQAVQNGDKYIKLDTDAILRKETSYTPYPTPFLYNVLEALVYKQQIRRMDYSVASRVISAILLITEGSDEFPVTEETRGNLDALKQQVEYYSRNPAAVQRLFPLFSNHTTKITWISPDVEAMLNQEKYQQVNDEISEGLGFAKILITGESRNAQASEVSTWAIQPMMEELREAFLEWLTPVYEEAATRNKFRHTPEPGFSPIRLQDFIKTAAVFAAAFKEGNVSRTTRDTMMGLNFKTELELMKDEKEMIQEADLGDQEKFPDMPYDYLALQLSRPAGAPNTGGRPTGTQNPPINKRNRGIKPPGQDPVSRVKSEIEPLEPEEVIALIGEIMGERQITVEDLE